MSVVFYYADWQQPRSGFLHSWDCEENELYTWILTQADPCIRDFPLDVRKCISSAACLWGTEYLPHLPLFVNIVLKKCRGYFTAVLWLLWNFSNRGSNKALWGSWVPASLKRTLPQTKMIKKNSYLSEKLQCIWWNWVKSQGTDARQPWEKGIYFKCLKRKAI